MSEELKACQWTLDDDAFNSYETNCGEIFYLEKGTPQESNMRLG